MKESLDELSLEQLEQLNRWLSRRVSVAKVYVVVSLLNLVLSFAAHGHHMLQRFSIGLALCIILFMGYRQFIDSTDRYIRKLKGTK